MRVFGFVSHPTLPTILLTHLMPSHVEIAAQESGEPRNLPL